MKRESSPLLLIAAAAVLAAAAGVICLNSCREAEEAARESAGTAAAVERPTTVFAPRVAGMFYPREEDDLRRQVGDFMGSGPVLGLRGLRAIVVPHAGYQYSGAVAANAFRELPSTFKTVFILADNHSREAHYTGVSFPETGAMEVPGAQIPVSKICWQLAEAAPDLFCNDSAAYQSHVVEVELPFLLAAQQWPEKPDFEVVPLILGGRLTGAQMERLADLLDAYVSPDSLFVVSTDLSHYQSDSVARQLDNATMSRILAKEGDELTDGSCCGLQAVRTILSLARRRGWETNLLGYDNSSTASGDTDRVVGYTALAMTDPLSFTPEEENALVGYARKVVETRVRTGEELVAEDAWLDEFPIFRLHRATFVTIKKDGQLRGCVGGISQLAPIHESVRKFALAAALQDRRFPPVIVDELDALAYSVSILTFPSKVEVPPPDYAEFLEPGKHGVILNIEGRQSTYLPSVWEQIPDPADFLANLCRKQGSEPGAWKSPPAVLHVYNALVLRET